MKESHSGLKTEKNVQLKNIHTSVRTITAKANINLFLNFFLHSASPFEAPCFEAAPFEKKNSIYKSDFS